MLPQHKIRYAMGVGLQPQNLLDAVKLGIDIFDCVAPTRNARHGTLYHGQVVTDGDWLRFDNQGENDARILIKKSRFAYDDTPIVDGCGCYTCRHFTRAYLHYLYKEKSALYCNLACIHNVYMMHHTCEIMRETITRI